MVCLVNKELSITEARDRLKGVAKKWFDNPAIDALTGGKAGYFQRFYTEVTNLDFDLGRLPNKPEMKKLEKAVSKYLTQIEKTPTVLGSLFKLPENILKKNPVTKKYFDDLVKISNYYRGNQQDIKGDLQVIIKALNKASGQNTMMSRISGTRTKAQKAINELESQWQKLKAEGKEAEARVFYEQNLKDLKKNPDTAIMRDLHDLLINPKLIDKQDMSIYRDTQLKYGGDLIAAANLWHYGLKGKKGEIQVEPLKERLWKVLGDGLRKSINVFEQLENGSNNMSFKVKELKRLHSDYFSKNAPKKPKNYFPTQVLDIAPTISKFSQDIHSGYFDKASRTVEGLSSVETYLNRMVENVTKNLSVSGNVFEKTAERPKHVSQDLVGLLDHYASSTIRFNYNAAVTESLVNAMKGLTNLSGSKYDQHVRFLSDYIFDMHQSVTGSKFNDSKLSNVSRSLTSFQFLSKLGLNFRSAFRNASQGLQHWVYFGTKGIAETFSALKDPAMKKIVDREIAKHGYEFVNIAEISMPKDLLTNVRLDETGRVIQDIPTMGAKFNDHLESVARVAGKPMQWVENNLNRSIGFKIAFITKYNELMNNPGIVEGLLKRKQKAKEPSATAIEEAIIKKSSDYAADMVKEIHYQYDPWAKIKATRGPVGSVLGQFSTYAINFFEYQRKIVSKGTNDALSGMWSSPEAWRMYRLGMLYTFVTGLSAMSNTNFGTIVQNDTLERAARLNQWLGGDEKDKEEAFFGLDPVTATFGGPFVSDVIRLGSVFNLNNMNSDEWASYTRGYQGFHDEVSNDKTEEIIRFLNTQLGRTIYTTLPRSINGTGLPTLVGQELGLYNTPELKELKKKLLYPFQQLPGGFGKYFTPKDKKRKKYYEGTQYTEEQIASILSAFE
tara:strand:- start:287 stop:2971 length:2685 start_codon:yes stop_codon:yes gene_type:complete